jgi:hypothetical protein
VSLIVDEFRGRTRGEQAEVVQRARRALDRGDLQGALAHARAADILRVPHGSIDPALVDADPERQAGKAGIEVVGELVELYTADAARRRVEAGMADMTEWVGLTGWAADKGFARKGDSRPYVEQVIG